MINLYVDSIHKDSTLPQRMTDDAAAWDVCAYLNAVTVKAVVIETAEIVVHGSTDGMTTFADVTINEDLDSHTLGYNDQLVLRPSERALIPTGLRVACDPGYCIKAYPRSGRSWKEGLSLVNCVALIDADYRNELFILVINHSNTDQVIHHGERIAQIKVEEVTPTQLVIGALPETTSKRTGGLGSTGK